MSRNCVNSIARTWDRSDDCSDFHKIEYEGAPEEEIEEELAARAMDRDIVSLTGKRPTKGSMREKVVIALEKLEVKHGVGEVTRQMLRTQCTKLGLDSQIIYQLSTDGYMISQ